MFDDLGSKDMLKIGKILQSKLDVQNGIIGPSEYSDYR